MAHGHGHGHHHHHHGDADSAARNIGIAFWLNLGFALVELIGGLLTQSLAVISDALHDFGDALSLGMGYFLQKKSAQGPSESFSYGLRRLSLLSAVISGVVISVGAIYILIESVMSFQEPREPHSMGMAGLAVFGIAVNGFAAWRMSHGHTHNEKMLRWHLIEDVLGWIAVLIGSGLIYVFDWKWIDPLLATGISAFVLYNVIRNLIATVNLFLQGNPDPEGLRRFRTQVEGMSEVRSIHDVHFWSLDGVRHILSLHVVLNDLGAAEMVKAKIRAMSRELGDCHVTLEIESSDVHCHNDCEHVHS
ncbi:MAG TPA: cation diffusion facilitator family transporter [Bdellovibrionales bacterium]|nr:cation diffusion facilitator family transporter [Bdellovibrionales bacterium]